MNINSSINKADPSSIIVEQILERSEYWNCMLDSIISMKEDIEHAEDEKSLMIRSSELKLHMSRMIKLKEYTEDIHMYLRMKSYSKYLQAMMEALETFRKLAAVDPDEYLPIVGILLGNVCHYYEKISPDREKALEAARESYQILSSIERNEMTETVYVEVKRMINAGASPLIFNH